MTRNSCNSIPVGVSSSRSQSTVSNQEQNTSASAKFTITCAIDKTVASNNRSQDEALVSDKPATAGRDEKRRRRSVARRVMDDSESELLIGLRAQKILNSAQIQEYFSAWSLSAIMHKYYRLRKEPRWAAIYDKVLQMEVCEQTAFVNRAKSAVTRYRSQRTLEQDQNEINSAAEDEAVEDEAVEDEAAAVKPLKAVSIDGTCIQEDLVKTTEPPVYKTWSNGRQSMFEPHPWDENEAELLIALRARGFSYHKLLERDFTSWSYGIRGKEIKLRKTDRWEARFQAILSMNETEQLATIASAQAAVARSRRRRAPAEKESAGEADAANHMVAHETATTESLERAPAEATDAAGVDESPGSDREDVDACEIPESPDPEVARSVPAQTSNNNSSSTNVSRPPRDKRLPARYRDDELL